MLHPNVKSTVPLWTGAAHHGHHQTGSKKGSTATSALASSPCFCTDSGLEAAQAGLGVLGGSVLGLSPSVGQVGVLGTMTPPPLTSSTAVPRPRSTESGKRQKFICCVCWWQAALTPTSSAEEQPNCILGTSGGGFGFQHFPLLGLWKEKCLRK